MTSYSVLKMTLRDLADNCVEEASGDDFIHDQDDPYGLIMSDKEDVRQSLFLLKITAMLTVDERQILLNGLAQEYSDAEDWLDYCSVNEATRHDQRREQGRAPGQQD